ncbi:efflux RND transporter periplasmic adaptor subunit [Lacinutrix sp. C3R15]|uniref:efflux RND transporter periplasmic adaptor subunit n=1 Tax=Flavobacteriaceae TaxID=49546 RepID=UPI001C09F8F6|nr:MULTISPECIES: efflux RND transporter periplasmic adaptor subunit [Flavobacteriaceae]MBU2940832.1 efflux RND transporter periplasmic adaptor subunit [Lacinutrix sp. C3R15]MDO6624150.1 efflux RND transporter periplasmic adaptor subunit [Oceanihabitans sp. 1_MG-2023]
MKNIYILLFSMVLIACGNSEKKESTILEPKTNNNQITVTKAQFEGEKMALGTLTEFNFNETIKVNGMIDVPPRNKSSVTTFIGGYITKTPLLIGDTVKKGQLLVTLENTAFVEIQQNYLEVAEQLNYLKSEFNRQKTLFDEKITSEKNYLKAESAYKSNLAHYNGLRKKLQMMHLNPNNVEQGKISSTINLYAPISGNITKVNVSNGTYVSPSDVILEIVDIDHIHLELSVFEKDILKIKKGQKILFKIPEASNKTYEAEVHLVGTTIDEQTRRVKVHAHVDNDKENFIVGMFVDADIIIDSKKAPSLPKEAIIESDNNFFVLTLKEENATEFYFEKIKLVTGKQTETYIEIVNTEALKEKQIVVKGTTLLNNSEE